MRILYLTNIPSPYRVDFFNELGKLCELTVIFERRSAIDRESSWLNNNYLNFKAIFLKGININNDTAFCLSVIKYLSKNIYDIFVIGGYATPTGMLATEYLRTMKKVFILNFDGGIIKNDNLLKYKLKKHFIGYASAWLSTGVNTDNYLKHYGANKDKIFHYPFTTLKEKEIIQNLVSIKEKNEIKNEIGIKEDKVLISVGQFIFRKGYDVLLKACENLDKNIGVYIIGGEATKEYLDLKAKLKLENVHFIKFLEKTKLQKYYLAADLFVLPTREDIWGLVINEAMAYGLPVITTNKCIAGLELIENNKNGFIIPTDDEIILTNKINIILNDQKLCEEMRENNLKKIKSYTIENMAERHLEIFKRMAT